MTKAQTKACVPQIVIANNTSCLLCLDNYILPVENATVSSLLNPKKTTKIVVICLAMLLKVFHFDITDDESVREEEADKCRAMGVFNEFCHQKGLN